MTDTGRHPTLDLADRLVQLASRVVWAAYDEQHGAALPSRTLDASVSGGSRSDPTQGRAFYRAASPDPDADGRVNEDPADVGAVSGNRSLAMAAPKLRKAVDEATRALDMLRPAPGRDGEGRPTGEKSCRVCGCCRAVHPKGRGKTATRCHSCYQFARRHNGEDRDAEDVRNHQEQMWIRRRDRAEQRRKTG